MRVTPRGGRDAIDGVESLTDGRSVVKVRVRAIAEGGKANRAVMELLAQALGVPKATVRILSGVTSRLKQVAVAGDPKKLRETLRSLPQRNKDWDRYDRADDRRQRDRVRASRGVAPRSRA